MNWNLAMMEIILEEDEAKAEELKDAYIEKAAEVLR